MFETKNLRNALKDAIINGVSPRPGTSWPNVSMEPEDLPRFEVTFAGINRTGGTLKGNEILTETGSMFVTVCVSKGTGENAAMDYADDIITIFPEGHRIDFTGGHIRILKPADPKAGFPDNYCYRMPVEIRYQANDSTL